MFGWLSHGLPHSNQAAQKNRGRQATCWRLTAGMATRRRGGHDRRAPYLTLIRASMRLCLQRALAGRRVSPQHQSSASRGSARASWCYDASGRLCPTHRDAAVTMPWPAPQPECACSPLNGDAWDGVCRPPSTLHYAAKQPVFAERRPNPQSLRGHRVAVRIRPQYLAEGPETYSCYLARHKRAEARRRPSDQGLRALLADLAETCGRPSLCGGKPHRPTACHINTTRPWL